MMMIIIIIIIIITIWVLCIAIIIVISSLHWYDNTSSVHSGTKALLISAVFALRSRWDADVAIFVAFARKRKPIASVAQEKRLKIDKNTQSRSHCCCCYDQSLSHHELRPTVGPLNETSSQHILRTEQWRSNRVRKVCSARGSIAVGEDERTLCGEEGGPLGILANVPAPALLRHWN